MDSAMDLCDKCRQPLSAHSRESSSATACPIFSKPTPPIEQSGPTDEQLAQAARSSLGMWLAWPDGPRDGPVHVTNEKTESWLAGLPARLAALTADKARDEALEEAAKVADKAASEADDKMHRAQLNKSQRNYAAAHVASKAIAHAIRSLKGAAK